MQVTVAIDSRLKKIATHLEPAQNLNITLARLLVKEVDRELAIYEQIDQKFQKQYNMFFEKFSHSKLMQKPTFAVEQDYFDWEMAVTIIKELRQESAELKPLINK